MGGSGAGGGAVTWLRRASCLKMGGVWEGMSPPLGGVDLA